MQHVSIRLGEPQAQHAPRQHLAGSVPAAGLPSCRLSCGSLSSLVGLAESLVISGGPSRTPSPMMLSRRAGWSARTGTRGQRETRVDGRSRWLRAPARVQGRGAGSQWLPVAGRSEWPEASTAGVSRHQPQPKKVSVSQNYIISRWNVYIIIMACQ